MKVCLSAEITSILISVGVLGNSRPIEDLRRRIVPLAQQCVLEIGVGPGVNFFIHYEPARVSKVYALEPNPGMLRRAEEQRRRTQVDIESLELPREGHLENQRPLGVHQNAGSFVTAVS